MIKKFISLVFPGVTETLASSRRSASKLISDDLPTLDRPMKANSGSGDFGHDFRSGALTLKTADLIFINGWEARKQPHRQPAVKPARRYARLSHQAQWRHKAVEINLHLRVAGCIPFRGVGGVARIQPMRTLPLIGHAVAIRVDRHHPPLHLAHPA